MERESEREREREGYDGFFFSWVSSVRDSRVGMSCCMVEKGTYGTKMKTITAKEFGKCVITILGFQKMWQPFIGW